MGFFRETLWDIAALSILTACGSLALRYMLGMNPYVLCILQRLSILAVGLAALSTTFFRQSSGLRRTIYVLTVSVPTVYGTGVAVCQHYIQSLPPGTVPEYGAPWAFRLRDWPLFEWYEPVIRGFGNCAVPDYPLGVPLPVWNVLYFCFVPLLIWFDWFRVRAVG